MEVNGIQVRYIATCTPGEVDVLVHCTYPSCLHTASKLVKRFATLGDVIGEEGWVFCETCCAREAQLYTQATFI